jgi:hypothetical protein
LWVGGTILNNPLWDCFIVCLCRKNDVDRAARFYNALKIFRAAGIMGDLDDGPDQVPLAKSVVEELILSLLPHQHFDLVITHNPKGEYTKHLRHEETSKAVIKLWHNTKIVSNELWVFAYEDGHKAYYPKAMQNATSYLILSHRIWLLKYNIITDTYGFSRESWEAKTTPKNEAFMKYTHSTQSEQLLIKEEL